MSKFAVKGAATGTGTFTLESPATNTDRTFTLPDTDGSFITADGSGNVTISGGLTLTSGTANGVTYLNGGKQVTSGSAFTFDGTTVGINTTIGNSTSLSITGDYTSNNVATFIGVQRIGGAVAGAWSYSDLLGSIQFGTTTNHSLVFLQNNAEAMRLTSTGLGIGTSLPAAKLHVEGTNAVMASTGLVTVQATTSGADVGGQITFQNNTARRAAIAGRQEASDAIAGYLQFGTRGTSGDITERLRLDSAGNLGLGVTPSAWNSSFNVMQVGGSAALYGRASTGYDQAGLYSNARFASGTNDWRYLVTTTGASGYLQSAGIHAWYNAPSGTGGNVISFTQAMTLDASGNLGVGTTSPSSYGGGARLAVQSSQTAENWFVGGSGWGSYVYISNNGQSAATNAFQIGQGFASGSDNIALLYNRANAAMIFGTNNTERARITSDGSLLVGTTSSVSALATTTGSVSGIGFGENGNHSTFTRFEGTPIYINRTGNDGVLIAFMQAGTEEGNISVSGTTVSYNGGHLARWAQMLTKPDLLKGTVMSNLDEMNVYVKPTLYWTQEDELPVNEEGNPTVAVGDVKEETSVSDNEQLNKVKVSDVEGDSNVAGVFVNWTYDEAHQVDEINMAMTGDMIIRIAQGVTVQRGDLLMSAGDGTAKPQEDDIVRSKTIAKVTSTHVTCTYEDGSYCVPCVLMAC